MLQKKTIAHIISNLGRGGAETMLVKTLKELPEYLHLVILLDDDNQFENELDNVNIVCLNKPSMFSILTASIQLNKIIKKHKVALVHSHLPLCNFIARLATPRNIPLISTIHTSIRTAKDYKKWYIRYLDKYTFLYRRSTIIAVSQNALDDYFSILKLNPGKSIVINSFVDLDQFTIKVSDKESSYFKVISTGSLREPKNQTYFLEAFKLLKNKNIELHIYGEGPLREKLQDMIDRGRLPVILKGQVSDVHLILPEYQLFAMSSTTEGFSVSVLEAMAVQLPLLLSDIPAFREQAGDCALYFDLNNTDDFVKKLILLKEFTDLRKNLAEKAYERLTDKYTLKHFLKQIREIYNSSIEQNE